MRKPRVSDEKLINLYNTGYTHKDMATILGYTENQIYLRLKKLKESGKINSKRPYQTGVISKCKHDDCVYLCYLSGVYACYYIGIEGHSRPCSPENCIVYKPNKDGKHYKDKLSRFL